jgi:hypothetical protein
LNAIDRPSHYQGAAHKARYVLNVLGIPTEYLDSECIKVIEGFDLNFHLGNAVKYLWRCDRKGQENEDLEKAKWYLQRWLQWTDDPVDDSPEEQKARRAIALIDELLKEGEGIGSSP